MIYREGFYKLSKKKRKNCLKKLIFLLVAVSIVFIVIVISNLEDYDLVGIFVFDEQVIRAPTEGIFKTDIKDMEKVRVGQFLGYIQTTPNKIEYRKDLLKEEYNKIVEDLDDLGEKINNLIEEIRVEIFRNDLSRVDKYVAELKRLSKDRTKIINKLEQISTEISNELTKVKLENSIYSLKSGYLIFTIDSLVVNNISLEYLQFSVLKKIRYFNYMNKKVRKDTVIAVVRDFPPKYLLVFSKIPVEKGQYILIKYSKGYTVKAKVLEVEFLKNFYKVTTLPIEFDNIILKERIIKGKIVRIL